MIYSIRHQVFSLRAGAVAFVGGMAAMLVAVSQHPASVPPDNSPVVFLEYAADPGWLDTHLGQFFGVFALLLGFLALHQRLKTEGPATVFFSSIGAAAAVAAMALIGVLQAIDGPALKFVVDRYATAPAEMSETALRVAESVRWIEVGVNSYFRIIMGIAVSLFGAALSFSRTMPRWLGWLAVVAGIGSIYQGYFVGHNGFSVSGNILAIAPTYITFAWVLVAAVTMWLRSRKLGASGHASVEGAVQPTA